MSDFQTYIWIVAGVITAVILPVVRAYVIEEFGQEAGDVIIPHWVKRYAALLVLALLAGGITFAIWKSNNPTEEMRWYTAFLLGFGWESAIEKIGRPRS